MEDYIYIPVTKATFGITGKGSKPIDPLLLEELATLNGCSQAEMLQALFEKEANGCLEAYSRGFEEGYKSGYKKGSHDGRNGIPAPGIPEDILNLPIETLGLPVRVFNCLKTAQCDTIGDLVQLDEEQIRRMRSLGKISADEVARALRRRGIIDSAWSGFLLKTY